MPTLPPSLSDTTPQRLAHLARRGYLRWRLRQVNRSLSDAGRCREIRHAELLEELHANGSSRFGRRYGLDAIGTIEDFRRRVPLTASEDCALPNRGARRPESLPKELAESIFTPFERNAR
jgi:hypothetical protein